MSILLRLLGASATGDVVAVSWGISTPAVTTGAVSVTGSPVAGVWAVSTPSVSTGAVSVTGGTVAGAWAAATPAAAAAGAVEEEAETVGGAVGWLALPPALRVLERTITAPTVTAHWELFTPTVLRTVHIAPLGELPIPQRVKAWAVRLSWSALAPEIAVGGVAVTAKGGVSEWAAIAPVVCGGVLAVVEPVAAGWRVSVPSITRGYDVVAEAEALALLLDIPHELALEMA